MNELIARFNAGDDSAGWQIVMQSGSVHAREEFLGAESAGDDFGMSSAVQFAIDAMAG